MQIRRIIGAPREALIFLGVSRQRCSERYCPPFAESRTKLLPHKDAFVSGLSGASGLLVADCGIDALILGHRLMRVEANFVTASPQRFRFGEKEEPPT